MEDPQCPGERLVVCRNPLVREERRRKRSELLAATERDLQQVQARVQAGRLGKAGAIGQEDDASGVAAAFHRLEDRVRAHVFLCMLAYYVQWHRMRAAPPARGGRSGL